MNRMRSLALFLLGVPALMTGQQSMPVAELVEQFKTTPIFWQQFEVAEKLAKSHDPAVLAQLEPYLRDSRAVPILIPLLHDREVNMIVPWSLGQIGDKTAVPALIETLRDVNPDMRVLAVYALETLKAKEALPQLSVLVNDEETIHFDGLGTVAEAARKAVAELQALP